MLKRTVVGRRFEAIGANPLAARAVGLQVRLHQTMAYVCAQVLYCLAGLLIAGITREPTAFQGDPLLLPSVAVVVLGGTSLLGGRGFPVSTVIAAFFLNQLSQTQKAISDIKSMAARGMDAMVVVGDAGPAVLPALTAAYKASRPSRC